MALIVAKPGPLRNSLFSLMTTLPEFDLVAESRDMASVQRMGAQIQPDLVVIEPALPENHLQETIRFIKSEWAASRTVILVEDVSQQQQAEEAGADVVLFKGFRAASLIDIVEDLFAEDPCPHSEIAPVRNPQC